MPKCAIVPVSNRMKGGHRVSQPLMLAAFLCLSGPVAAADTLYFADIDLQTGLGQVRRVETDGSGLATLVDVGSGLRGLAVDLVGKKLYWSNVYDETISRANLDGSTQEVIVDSGLSWPRCLAIDLGKSELIWGDQVTYELGRSELDGSDYGLLRTTAFHAGLVIDSAHGKMYWTTDKTMYDGDIVRSNLDGTGLEVVVTGVDKPGSLTVDSEGGKLYWTDYVVDVVRRSNLDGSEIEDIYAVGSNRNPRGIALNLDEGKVYWGQDIEIYGTTGKIMRADLDGSRPELVVDGVSLVCDLSFGERKHFATGDVNCDEDVNFDDIDPFVTALTSERRYGQDYPDCNVKLADINKDGSVDFDDIDPFVELLIR